MTPDLYFLTLLAAFFFTVYLIDRFTGGDW